MVNPTVDGPGLHRAWKRTVRRRPRGTTGAVAVIIAVILLTAGCGDSETAPTVTAGSPTRVASAASTQPPTSTPTPERPTTQLQGMLDQLNALIVPTAIRTSAPTPTATVASAPSSAGTAAPTGPAELTPGPPGATSPTPASPFATPVGTPDVATPTATPVLVMATPSPIAVVEADGYLLGLEHGLALAQTTRAESPTHQGWVDITLALAVVNIVPDTLDAPNFETQEESTSICLVSGAPPEDCIMVVWGSSEQHRADLSLSRVADAAQRPRQNVWPLSVIFELPANAMSASLRFGDHRLPLNLEGDAPFVPNSPEAVPVPVESPGALPGTSAYFLGEDYGIAIAGLTRSSNDGLPGWATANLFLAVIRLADDRSFAPAIRIDTETGQTCFLGEDNDNKECPRIVWGPEERFESAVRLSPVPEDGTLPWPRGMGWPVSLTFDVPDRVQNALLGFGGHKISLALHGMAQVDPIIRTAVRLK